MAALSEPALAPTVSFEAPNKREIEALECSLNSLQWRMLQLSFDGSTIGEIAAALGYREATVRRLLDTTRLRLQMTAFAVKDRSGNYPDRPASDATPPRQRRMLPRASVLASLSAVPLELQHQIDQICDDYEASWSPQSAKRIEKLLENVAPEVRPVLARELVRLEASLRHGRGEAFEPAEWLARYLDGRTVQHRSSRPVPQHLENVPAA